MVIKTTCCFHWRNGCSNNKWVTVRKYHGNKCKFFPDFCRADLKSLCQEALLSALCRRHRQIYNARPISRGDFYTTLHRPILAYSCSCQYLVGRPLDMNLFQLLNEVDQCLTRLPAISSRHGHWSINLLSDDRPLTTTTNIKHPTTSLISSFTTNSYRSTIRNGFGRLFTPAVV